jgi:hypothetical protein
MQQVSLSKAMHCLRAPSACSRCAPPLRGSLWLAISAALWFYLMRLYLSWTSRLLARSSPASCLAAGSCSYGRGFAFGFFQP